MVQSRNYLSAADCVACFTAAVSQVRNCSAANGGRVIYDGCFLSLVLYSKLLAATFLMRAHIPLELRRTTMAFKPAILQHMNPTISCCLKQPYEFQQLREKPLPLKGFEFHVKRRRIGAMAAISWVALLAKEALYTVVASGFELPLVAPDQTVAEAEDEIRGHAQALLEVKDLIEFESWKELQATLRKSSSLLKQDFYTIIQGKPASERPQLRKLYTDLFNNVTRLDYATRDKDASYIRQCYDNIVVVLDQILSRI